MDTKFSDLGLSPHLLKAIEAIGFEQPSPIQAETIPAILEGQNIVGLSQTGSGKTAAFGLPLLERLKLENKSVQALVLCPTRELAVQVCEEIQRLGSVLENFYATSVYGGAPIDRQIKFLKKGVHLVVGTPGRIIDHLKRKTLKLGGVKLCVLDEADRMLDMGFKDDMETILDALPDDTQKLFFSATMNKSVRSLIKAFSPDAQTIQIEKRTLTVESIEQMYYEVRNRSKIEVLSRLLDMEVEPKGIIFCNTKQMVEEVCEVLALRGYIVDRIHGDITQVNRERVIKRFREGKVELLVATDVAARGLDIDAVGIVFNYDLPYDPEDYVHRIGRTGRAGNEGKSVTFVFGKDIHRLELIERYIKQPIQRMKIPSQEEVEGKLADSVLVKVRDLLETKNFDNYEHMFDRLLETGNSAGEITSALLHMIKNQDSRERETITEDSEPFSSRPLKHRKKESEGGRSSRKRKSRFKRFGQSRQSTHSIDAKKSGDRNERFQGNDSKPKRKNAKIRKDKGKPSRAKRKHFKL